MRKEFDAIYLDEVRYEDYVIEFLKMSEMKNITGKQHMMEMTEDLVTSISG